MILYDAHHLAPCYAVRLLAGCLGLAPELRPLDVYPGHEHRAEAFLAINPLGTLPVLVHGDHVLTDWQEILAHLALTHDRAWIPAHDAALFGWLGMARDLGASAGAAQISEIAEPARANRANERVAKDHFSERGIVNLSLEQPPDPGARWREPSKALVAMAISLAARHRPMAHPDRRAT